ncbi:MAG: hypothetical protein M3P00_12695 [Gemmatimonadota bacterium]|nr:hypothetical protein [Gemmatimonadota bacterium]
MLPELSIRVAQPGDVLWPSEAEDEVRFWPANPGLELFGYSGRTYNWVHASGWATFRFRPDDLRVDAFPDDGRDPSTIREIYEQSVLPLILQAAGREVLHASAVHDGESVFAFAGVSTSGKSTLAHALARRNVSLWADDAVAFFVEGEALVMVASLPFTPRLRPGAPTLAKAPLKIAPPRRRADAPLACVILLRPEELAPGDVRFERERPSEAFAYLLRHAYCFSLDDTGRNRQMIREYLRLVERVPVWTLRFRRRPEDLPRISGELERFLVRTAATE